jgi:putative heme-binding domain-containing protein
MALRDQLLKDGVYAQLSAVVGDDRDALARLANVSLGVPNADAADFVWRQLQLDRSVADRDAYLHHVARRIVSEKLPEVFAVALAWGDLGTAQRVGVLRALGRGTQERGAKLPDGVAVQAVQLACQCLAAESEADVRGGIELARDLKLTVFAELAKAAGTAARFDGLRPAAIDACVDNDPAQSVSLLAGILSNATEPTNLRQHTARALARINDEPSRAQLLKNLHMAPERLAVEIATVLADTPQGAEILLATITEGKASARLLQEQGVVRRLGHRGVKNLNERLAKLTAGLPTEDERIRTLIESRARLIADGKADLAQGAAVFEKHCAVCHRIGEKGAKIGPNLDGVGIRGLDRLLEDILIPNRNVDQAFRTTQIVSTDGRILTGLALREEGEVLVLADAQGKEVRVPKDEIEVLIVSQLSVMPGNVPDIVSDTEFVHLIGYLLSQRVAGNEERR